MNFVIRYSLMFCFWDNFCVIVNLFLANVPILYPPENGFLVFSEGIKWEHWPEKGYSLYLMLKLTFKSWFSQVIRSD